MRSRALKTVSYSLFVMSADDALSGKMYESQCSRHLSATVGQYEEANPMGDLIITWLLNALSLLTVATRHEPALVESQVGSIVMDLV